MNVNNENKLVNNIARPKLIWINDTHCYRVTHEVIRSINTKRNSNIQQLAPYYDNDEHFDETCENKNSDDPEIEVTENGRFKISCHIPSYYYRFIIGAKGSRRRKIEDEANCSIKIPSSNSSNSTDMVIITGPTERSVISGLNRINMVVNEMKNKHEFTHFVSIPMNSETIQKNFEKFKKQILLGSPIRGMEESIFQNPKKLHLTLGVMVLLDEYETNLAVKVLEECRETIIRPTLEGLKSFVKIRMFGIDYMNDDPENVDVLYAKVEVLNKEYKEALQSISDEMFQLFCKRGLMKKQYEKVKLHVTLINTRYRTQEKAEEQNQYAKRRNQRTTFDATDILKEYSDFNFGEIPLESIHISVRFNVNETGFYESLSAVSTLNYK